MRRGFLAAMLTVGLLVLAGRVAQAQTTTTTSTSSTSTTSTSSTTLAVGFDTPTFQTACDVILLPVLPARENRKHVRVKNTSSTVAYLCLAPICTTTTGYPLAQNEVLDLTAYGGPMSFITASGTATLAVANEFRF